MSIEQGVRTTFLGVSPSFSRRSLIKSSGMLIVGFSLGELAKAQETGARFSTQSDIPIDQLDSYLAIGNDEDVTVFTGRIDMGTGNRTCFAQMVADELDVALDRISLVCGDTALTPDGGKTTASDAISTGGQPLRATAAAARKKLLELGAEHLGVQIEQLAVRDGIVSVTGSLSRQVSYGELIGNQRFDIRLEVDRITLSGPLLKVPDGVSLKTVDEYRHVRQSVARIDLPDRMITGTFCQNVRVTGMLHGRCIRPPSVGSNLLSVDEGSVRDIPGFVQLVVQGNFVGVVCEREEQAIQAQKVLEPIWSDGTGLPGSERAYRDIRTAAPDTRTTDPTQTLSHGDVDVALMDAAKVLTATYEYPWNAHTMLGPTCAVADVREDGATIWSGTQWPRITQKDLAFLLDLPVENVRVIWVEESGSYGRLAAADAAADAALLSRAVERPVRVQWTRLEEHAWAPHQPPLAVDVRAGLNADNTIVAWDVESWTSTPHDVGRGGGLLAMRLVGRDPGPWSRPTLGASALNSPYPVPNLRSVNHTVEPLLRACYMRSPGGLQATFFNESFIDELASAAGVDPVAFRLRQMSLEPDGRSIEVLQAAAAAVNWDTRPSPKPVSDSVLVIGRGVARSETSVTVAEVEVDRSTGIVRVIRLTAALDCGLIVNPDGLTNQVEQAALQGMSRALMEEVTFDNSKITSVDWITHPIMKFSEVPTVQVVLLDRPDEAPQGAGEPGTTQLPAAIGNAIFDATGVRIRRAPFTPERVRTALAQA